MCAKRDLLLLALLGQEFEQSALCRRMEMTLRFLNNAQTIYRSHQCLIGYRQSSPNSRANLTETETQSSYIEFDTRVGAFDGHTHFVNVWNKFLCKLGDSSSNLSSSPLWRVCITDARF